MSDLFVDTHALVWYLFDSKKFKGATLVKLEETVASGGRLFFSTISLVEILYLVEKERLVPETYHRLFDLIRKDDPRFAVYPLTAAIVNCMESIPRRLVPDMPDRIIAGSVIELGLPLVTRDSALQALDIATIW